MKISAYIRPGAAVNPTGVGKHQINMIKELHKRDDVDLECIVPMRDLNDASNNAVASLSGIKTRLIPWSSRAVERMWNVINMPGLDSECEGADCLYCPFEAMPPVKKIPRVATVHQMMWFDTNSQWYGEWGRIRMVQRRVFRRIAEECEVILCVSSYLKERFTEFYPSASSRVHVVPNGADEIFFNAWSPAREGRKKDLVIVGPMTERKGAKLLFDVAERLAEVSPASRIVAVGGKCGSPDLIEKAEKYHNIRLHGYLSSESIVDIMNSSMCLLQVSPTETFGIPVVEAMAVGLPVIGVRAMATEEVMGTAGMLVNDGDADGICQAAASLFADSDKWKDLVEVGKNRAEKFRWPICAARLMEILNERIK